MTYCDMVEENLNFKIYINDRPYNIADIGEGKCEIILVDHNRNINFNLGVEDKRFIIVDVTQAWAMEINDLDDDNLHKLAADIHLLADVYWLDSFVIHSGGSDALYKLLQGRLRSRMLSQPLSDYY